MRAQVLLTAILLTACGRAEEPGAGAPPLAATTAAIATSSADAAPRAQAPTYATPGPDDRGPVMQPVVALVPSDDAAITDALATGLRLAFDEARAASGPDLALRLSTRTAAWGSAVEGAVRDAVDTDAIALVAPPERRHAHLLVQLGTRVHLPVVATSPARSVVGAGSSWVVAVVPAVPGVGDGPPMPPDFDAGAPAATSFTASFRAAQGRSPGPWDAAGYDAGRAIVEAVRRNGLHRSGLLGALVHGEPVLGALGEISFDASGGRRAAARTDADRRTDETGPRALTPDSANPPGVAAPETRVAR